MRQIFLILFIISACTAECQKSRKIDFAIYFGDCFHSDTVSIAINDIQFLNSIIVNSDPCLGFTDVGIYQNRDSLFIVNTKSHSEKRITITKNLSLKIIVNKHITKYFNVNLRKGKFVLIDYCTLTNSNEKGISYFQLNKPIKLE